MRVRTEIVGFVKFKALDYTRMSLEVYNGKTLAEQALAARGIGEEDTRNDGTLYAIVKYVNNFPRSPEREDLKIKDIGPVTAVWNSNVFTLRKCVADNRPKGKVCRKYEGADVQSGICRAAERTIRERGPPFWFVGENVGKAFGSIKPLRQTWRIHFHYIIIIIIIIIYIHIFVCYR